MGRGFVPPSTGMLPGGSGQQQEDRYAQHIANRAGATPPTQSVNPALTSTTAGRNRAVGTPGAYLPGGDGTDGLGSAQPGGAGQTLEDRYAQDRASRTGATSPLGSLQPSQGAPWERGGSVGSMIGVAPRDLGPNPTSPTRPGVNTGSVSTGSSSTSASSGPQGPGPNLQPWNPNGAEIPDIASQLQKFFDPSHKAAQEQLSRSMLQNAAVTGQVNSGGFGVTQAQGMGDLIGQQQAQIGQMAFQGREAQLDRILKDNQFANQFELEKWVNSNKFALEQAGINSNELMARYAADRGVDQARIGAGASMYGDDIRRQLGMIGYDVERENNIMDYQLGLQQLTPEMLRLIFGASADNFVTGNPLPPGNTLVRP
jgi:hypothetical protein